MSDIAITNNMGRDFSVAVATGLNNLLVNNVVLKAGLNLLKGDMWDKIKSHPAVQALTETEQNSRISRIEQIAGGSGKTFFTIKENIGRKKLEVVDYRKGKKD